MLQAASASMVATMADQTRRRNGAIPTVMVRVSGVNLIPVRRVHRNFHAEQQPNEILLMTVNM